MFFAIASLVMTIASAAASARSQYAQGKQAEENAEYNAKIAEQDADEEQAARAVESTDERKLSRRTLAHMEAKYAKSGLLMAGTPMQMMIEQAESDEFNILSRDRVSNIRSQNFRTEADLLRMQGKDAAKAGRTGAITSLLTGSASAMGTGASYGLRVGSQNPRTPSGTTYQPTKMSELTKSKSSYNSILSDY